MFDWIGWAATVIFTASYLCKQPATMRRVQALGAVFWLMYGILIHSAPVIVSNIIVAAVAIYSSLEGRSTEVPGASLR
jgi:uncharacterized protein with PQ loop repeat